jgi:hypothetical protein
MTTSTTHGSIRKQGERLSLDRIAVTGRTSLALSDGIAIEEWRRLGVQIHEVSNSSTWWLGDWLIYGRKTYPGRYREAVGQTSLDYQTLRNYAWVAGRISPDRRRAELSFQHHAEVAPLPPDQQQQWLARAAAGGWSRNRLRTEIRATTRGARQAAAPVRIRVQDDHLRRWQSAASHDGRELFDWMISALDEAALSVA